MPVDLKHNIKVKKYIIMNRALFGFLIKTTAAEKNGKKTGYNEIIDYNIKINHSSLYSDQNVSL